MVAIDHRRPQSTAPFTQKQKKKLPITAIYNKMIISASCSHNTSAISNSAPSEVEEDDDEDEEQRQQGADKGFNGTHTLGCHTSSLYSLTSGPLTRGRACRISGPSTTSSSRSGRRKHQQRLLNSSASDSLSSSFTTESLGEERDSPVSGLIHPTDHMKTLLARIRSSISASKAAFTLMRASSNPCVSAENVYGRAEKAIAEELETLSNLHMRLYSLIQEHADFGMKQADSSYETSSNNSTPQNTWNVQRQDAMLKSYEGIIIRFHDEIRKKNAVTEALKGTLAKSMLKGEKLERRIKALERKLSRV